MQTADTGSLSLDAYVQSRQIGEAVVTIICEAYAPWAPQLRAPEVEWRRAMPEADADGAIPLDFLMACIRIGESIILVDPGFEEPSSPWERQRAIGWKGLKRSPGLYAWLSASGIAPDQITHVLITHTHHDHYAGVASEGADGRYTPRFPRARHLMGRRDWEDDPERQQPGSELSLRLGAVERAGLLELVDTETEVVSGITLLPAPGETPGHCIVRVRSQGASFYYLSDLFHHTCEIEHPDWVSPGRDQAAMRRSRDRLFAATIAEDATLVYAHHPFPGWGRIRPAGGGYGWEAEKR
jgi:glyoxylase-like metal-dependent hydrolase (beta-lactamase superfamily II)